MRFVEQKDKAPIAVLNEFDVHHMLCVGRQMLILECEADDDAAQIVIDEHGGSFDRIVIEPCRPERFTKSMIKQWEQHMNKLFETMQELDRLIHVDAEYTC